MLTISGQIPSDGDKNIDKSSNIEFIINDDGNGIDLSTLIVEVLGERVLVGTDFKSGYDGVFSEITPDGNDYIIVIDPENDFSLSQVIPVKIQVRNLLGDYTNEQYAFKITPAEPQLVSVSPAQDAELETPQFIYFEFEDLVDGIDTTSIDISINGLSYVISGSIQPNINGHFTTISLSGNKATVRIDTLEPLRIGDYTVQYSVADNSGNYLNNTLDFSVIKQPSIDSGIKQIEFLGYFQGIEKVSDLGRGDAIHVEWNKPLKRDYRYDVFSLIYQNEKRLEIFDNPPTYIAPESTLEGTVVGLTPGVTLSYAARAMEALEGVFDLTGMQEMDSGLYIVPGEATISSQVNISDLRVSVDSVAGWPSSGLIQIGNEVLRYESLLSETNQFVIAENGRGLFNSTPNIYITGDKVSLFFGCQDENTVIVMSTPSYQDGYQSGRVINSTGIIVPDFTDNDRKFFEGFDFCGYHHPRPQDILQGDSCGSYIGGEHNGWKGMNLYDRMLNREEVLLDQVGEPVVLLRRIWDGEKCTCATSRRDHPKLKSCPECFGTTYVGGYLQYENRRREDKRIMMSFKEAQEDLKHGAHEHLQQEFEPGSWTLPVPAIKDRDIIIRFDFTDDIEYIYEVLDSSREKLMYRHFGRQNLRLKRMDKTDILYTLIKSSIINNDFIPTIE